MKKLLQNTFNIAASRLPQLTPLQLYETTARKLLKGENVKIKKCTNFKADLKKSDLHLMKNLKLA